MGGTGCNKRIAWVSWSNICKPKKEGGLGIRDLRLVNNALLAKWRWRILTKGLGLCRDITLARYGSLFSAPHLAGRLNGVRGVSLWWSDVSLLGTRVDSHSDWFSEGVTVAMGLRLPFGLTLGVADMGSWVTGEWEWELRWKTDLDMQDQDLLNDLMESLRQVHFSTTEDEWCWRHEPSGLFSVKSAYLVLEDGARLQRTLPVIDFVNLARVWDSWTASKVIVFSWQLLQDRVPTWQNLRRRRVMVGATDISCVICGAVEESVDHLFVSCDWISPI
ncbi:hypothetical protein TSUD_194930 [Trifolium subterraneum]|nr:hypothetical protein TSUD_194930 [Trifolium subterraneum]